MSSLRKKDLFKDTGLQPRRKNTPSGITGYIHNPGCAIVVSDEKAIVCFRLDLNQVHEGSLRPTQRNVQPIFYNEAA